MAKSGEIWQDANGSIDVDGVKQPALGVVIAVGADGWSNWCPLTDVQVGRQSAVDRCHCCDAPPYFDLGGMFNGELRGLDYAELSDVRDIETSRMDQSGRWGFHPVTLHNGSIATLPHVDLCRLLDCVLNAGDLRVTAPGDQKMRVLHVFLKQPCYGVSNGSPLLRRPAP